MHHLLGPSGRRLHAGRRVPARSMAPQRRGAARQRDGHAALPRRPAHAGGGSHQGREAAAGERGADHHQDPRAAHLVRRRAAAARGPARARGAGGVARRARHHPSRRPRTRPRAPAREVRPEPPDAVRRHRAHCRRWRARRLRDVGGSDSLEALTNDEAGDIEEPETKLSAWKRAQLRAIAGASSTALRQEARQRADLRIDALGSGSDFTPFLQHVGVATLNLGFGGEGGGGIYHSIYDDFKWYTTFDDTAFVYGRALAQTVGTAAMRLADAQVLPDEFTRLAGTGAGDVKGVEKLVQGKQD